MTWRNPHFLGFAARPSKPLRVALGSALFVLCLVLYLTASHLRHRDNPQDKILPSFGQMATAVYQMGFQRDTRTGEYLMLVDTASSLRRLFIGVLLAAALGLVLGLNMGLFPGVEALTAVFVTVVSIIPPLAVLPILFIAFGVDEFAKIMLILIGTFPLICRDIYLYTKKLPYEQVIKSLTLGAGAFTTAYRIVLPQVMPRLLEAMRLSFGAAWLFLIAAEAIASTDGLGYRIFLMRRYLAMDVIIPYVFLITALGFAMDVSLKRFVLWRFRWYSGR